MALDLGVILLFLGCKNNDSTVLSTCAHKILRVVVIMYTYREFFIIIGDSLRCPSLPLQAERKYKRKYNKERDLNPWPSRYTCIHLFNLSIENAH